MQAQETTSRSEDLQYWIDTMRDASGVLEFCTDRPRPSIQGCEGKRLPFELGVELASSVRAQCAALGTAPETVLLAGLTALLSRYTGQRDFNLAFRRSVQPATTAPMLVSARLDDMPDFAVLAARMENALREAGARQPMPLAAVIEALRLPPTASHAPLAQVCLVFTTEADGEADLQIGAADLAEFGSGFDLLVLLRDDARMSGAFVYSSELFESATIERLAAHFRKTLQGATCLTVPVLRLPVLAGHEHEQLVSTWNATDAPFPDTCVHQIFEARVSETPEAPAVVFGNEMLTYAQLNARANMLACSLRQGGVGPDVLVGVCATRSIEMIVALLGVLKAGGAYVPLDPAYPQDRLRYMIEDARPALLLSQEALRPVLPPHDIPVLWLDGDWPAIAKNDASNPQVPLSPEALAYVIYTSGSTGRPKGVTLAHRGLCNLCVTQASAFQIERESQVLQFASISFDAAVSEAFVTLTQGACLHLVRPEALRSGLEILKLMESSAITTVTLPPSLLAVLPKKPLPALKTLVLAGEAWSPELAKFWGAGRRMLNAYGPTEGTVCATWWEVTPEMTHRVPIGRPLPNVRIYILDEFLQPVPIGVAGELYIAGIGLARGYLNRPDLTAEKFIANPYSVEPGARMYRTGDKARYLADGNIEFLGRIDHQVKLRGYRIELGEIEASLSAHESVSDVVVMVREDHPGEKRLVAYVIRCGDVDARDLRTYVKSRLPDYMIPQNFVFVDAFPNTPNGKVDRKALPPPHAVQ